MESPMCVDHILFIHQLGDIWVVSVVVLPRPHPHPMVMGDLLPVALQDLVIFPAPKSWRPPQADRYRLASFAYIVSP